MTKNERDAVLVLLWGIYLSLLVGWIMNIISIWNSIDNPLTPKFILRVVGVFVAPIGAILGFF